MWLKQDPQWAGLPSEPAEPGLARPASKGEQTVLPFIEDLRDLQQCTGGCLSFVNNTVHVLKSAGTAPEVDIHEDV